MFIISPYSKAALLELGMNLNDLFFLTPKEYLDINVDLKFVDADIQLKKYNHFNERRENKISEALQKRKEFIQNGGVSNISGIIGNKNDRSTISKINVLLY